MRSTTASPWAPFKPTADDPWDVAKVAHLHRRAGFGATWAELVRDRQAGPEASVLRLLHPPRPAALEMEAIEGLRQTARAARLAGGVAGGGTRRGFRGAGGPDR
jgi:hypothetical protein